MLVIEFRAAGTRFDWAVTRSKRVPSQETSCCAEDGKEQLKYRLFNARLPVELATMGHGPLSIFRTNRSH
jgi:hypothetical protein